ncbi:gamma-glutamylcyclotransferase family protein [Alishewanella tabrizica]|uniref:Gamma-glutamylcyclotransferase n=1 Tax=Alishewanella tabrizica TaxID=671278 RepID=A0ABQ2WRE3_9ALTE|nr:gamma-glutamylcyclotransferase family protein [Alishewanella tabrizica]GGW66855.1 gamma-glutamylcyclotransferase [Alishewanella tabrizica]
MFTEYLFVYGTLRRAAQHPIHQRMLRYVEFFADGHVAGQLYSVGAYPALVIKSPTYEVKGELYKVLDAAKLWPLLDQYEGVGQGFVEPHEYRKAQISAIAIDGQHYVATTYLYNRDISGLRLLPHGDFLADQ